MSKEDYFNYEAGDLVRHFKTGQVYTILDASTIHTETNEELVVYQEYTVAGMVALWGNCFARPKAMFEEVVDGKLRFELVGSIDSERDIKIKRWED